MLCVVFHAESTLWGGASMSHCVLLSSWTACLGFYYSWSTTLAFVSFSFLLCFCGPLRICLSCFESKFQCQLFRLKAGKRFLTGNLKTFKKKFFFSPLKVLLTYMMLFFICLMDTRPIHLFTLIHPLINHVLNAFHVPCFVLHTKDITMLKNRHIQIHFIFFFMPFSRSSSYFCITFRILDIVFLVSAGFW